MKKYAFITLFAGIVSLLTVSAVANAEDVAMWSSAPEAGVPVPQDVVTWSATSHEDITRQSIQEKIRSLRQERVEKMPYLNPKFIKQAINKDSVQKRVDFSTKSQKNLQDVINRALEVHTPAIAAKERINLAKRRVIAGVRELFPELSIRRQHRDGTLGGNGPFNSSDYRFIFTQPIFRGGVLWHTLLQEKAEMESIKKEYDQVVSDAINEVSAAYFEYNRAVEVTTDGRKSIEKVKRFVEISQKKWDQELISEIEHLNVQSLYSQMQFDHESAKQELELAKLELQKFLDVDIDESIAISALYSLEELIQTRKVPGENNSLKGEAVYAVEGNPYGVETGSEVPNLEVLVDLAYQNRPELQVESSRLNSARLEERIRWGEMLPRLDLTIEFGKLGEAFNQNADNPTGDDDPKLRKEFRLFMELQWNFMGNNINYQFENDDRAPTVTQFQGGGGGTQTTRNTLTIGILDGLEGFVNAKEAEVEKLDQIVELENAEKEVIRDVKEAYYDYQRALIQVKSTIKRAEYRDRLLKLSRHRLDNNEIEISEYLQAGMDLVRERTELHRALTDYFTAKAELNRAVGRQDFLTIEETYSG